TACPSLPPASVLSSDRLTLRLFAAAGHDASKPVQCEEHQDQPEHPSKRTADKSELHVVIPE
ncbi:MAG: hypothetical protein ACK6EB_18905, partial [Planctomyces sp.]